MRDHAFVFLQYLVPRHWLTALIWRIARIRYVPVKDFLIRRFAAAFDVKLDEVRGEVPADFPTFNDFFIRELKDDARQEADLQQRQMEASLAEDLAVCRAQGREVSPPWRRRLQALAEISGRSFEEVDASVAAAASAIQVVEAS